MQPQDVPLAGGFRLVQRIVEMAYSEATPATMRWGMAVGWLALFGLWCVAAWIWSLLLLPLLVSLGAPSGSLGALGIGVVVALMDAAFGLACVTARSGLRVAGIGIAMLGFLARGIASGMKAGFGSGLLAGFGALVCAEILFVLGVLLIASASVLPAAMGLGVRSAD